MARNYLRDCLSASGLTLREPPDPSELQSDEIVAISAIKQALQRHYDFPRNVADLVRDFRDECKDLAVFRHYVFPNLVQVDPDTGVRPLTDSVLKLLLSVPPLQDQLSEYVFERAIDFAVQGACGPWIKTILRCFTTLNHISCPDKIATNIIDLLDVTTEHSVRLEIIAAIPDLVGDREHDNVAEDLSRFLNEDVTLIPAVLDCLSYLCLSDDCFRQLQNKAIAILRTSVQFRSFPNFVKFLLMPGRMDDAGYVDTVQGLRNALSWVGDNSEEISSSQILTASAIRNSITASEDIAAAWFKSVQMCKLAGDHKSIDVVLLLILCSTTDEKQKMVVNLLRKHIKLDILKEDLLDEAFAKFYPIFNHYLQNMLELVNSLLMYRNDDLVVSFASHLYVTMFSQLEDSRQTIIIDLLQGMSCKQSLPSMLYILKTIADKDISWLKPQSLQMLALVDKLDDLKLSEVREIMNLLCGLAYGFENSVIRDDIHMMIRKQLESSNPLIKIRGVLAAVQAVKYLTRNSETGDDGVERSEDISYSSYDHLAEGDTREAAHIIELISRSVRQVPEMFGLFYDELSEVFLSASYVNPSFLAWLTDAVTNDLQQNFIVDNVPTEKIKDIEVSMQYMLNDEDELESIIAINVAELSLQTNKEDAADIFILPSLFRLVQISHAKKNDSDLSDIDALLGSPVILPNVNLEHCTEDLNQDQVFYILNCLIHCTNWFRELVNGFAGQTNNNLRQKIMHRIAHIEEIEHSIHDILTKIKTPYKPPLSTFNVSKYMGEQKDKKHILTNLPSKAKTNKKPTKLNDTTMQPTLKSQVSQLNIDNTFIPIKLNEQLPLRKLHLNIIILLNNDLCTGDQNKDILDLISFKFILLHVNQHASYTMVSRIKKNSHLFKQENVYDPIKAESTAKQLFNIIPKLMLHLEDLTKAIRDILKEHDDTIESLEYTKTFIDLQMALECLLNTFSIYFKWIEFRKQQHSLLKSSLRSITSKPEYQSSKVTSLRELLLCAAKMFLKLEDCCILVPTAVSLIEVVKAISELTESETIIKIAKTMAKNFLSKQWKSCDGSLEKGLIFNQFINLVMTTYFLNPEVGDLKAVAFQTKSEIKKLSGKNDNFVTLKCISKANFTILFRHLVGAVYVAAKNELDKGLTDREHLELWKETAKLLKTLSEIAKTLENRNNLSTFLKKSQPIIKLFLSQGMPIMKITLKTKSELVIEIFKEFQHSTKFLQSLCCHSRLKKDSALMAKVPQVRLLLERFIYKVKAALAANNCSEAFWMGNLKNKNIQGEVITTQESVNDGENGEDSDDQLPEDNECSSEDDDDLLNPESKSISDIN